MIGIYKWTNKTNNKSYIGQSVNIQERQKKHIAASYYPKSNTYNTAFHKAIRKYGVEQFDFEIVCLCKEEELDVLEKFYIEKFNTYVPNGYNMTTGGENPRCCNHRYSIEDIKQIIKELQETDDSADDIAKRWDCSASLIKKISYGEEYCIEGISYPVRSEEHIQRIRRKYSLFCQGINPAAKLDIPTVEKIVYDLLESSDSIKQIADKYNICADQVSRINNGKAWLQVERPIPCRDTKKENEAKALMVAQLLLNTNLSQAEILAETGYKDRHTVQRINNHTIYTELLREFPNPIRR